MGKNLTLKQLQTQVMEWEKTIENKSGEIAKLYEEINDLHQKIRKTTIKINDIKYRDIEIKEGQCFHYINKKWSYHDIKEIIKVIEQIAIVGTLKGNEEHIIFREYVIKDYDGDTEFFIRKKLDKSKGNFIDDLNRDYKEISKEEAQEKIDEWIKICD